MNQTNTQAAKVALITGAARRIGAAIVTHLHAAGFKVVIHCRSALAEAHALANRLNAQRMDSALVLQRELTEPGCASEMIDTVIAWAGRLDLLVNNASLFKATDCDAFHETDAAQLFYTNVTVPFLLSLAARPFLSQHAGAIINLSDKHAQKPLKGYSLYCQSKAALDMQTKSLAREWAPDIRVNAVAPGSILWPENENSLKTVDQEKILAKTLLKGHGDAAVIAQAVLALAENSFITGQILTVDGGRSLL